MNKATKAFIAGAIAGIAAVKVFKTDSFRKGCARILSTGLGIKNDATEFVETVKEEAEDLSAEAEQKKNSSKK